MQKSARGGAWNAALLVLLALCLAGGGASVFLFPAPRFSAAENRYLAEAPTWSVRALFSGEFSATADAYMTERFPARGVLRAVYAVGELALGKREVGGVILCRDGSLSRRTAEDPQALARNLAALARFSADISVPVTVAAAPRRLEARREVLPRSYDTAREAQAWETLSETLPQSVTFPTLTADEAWYRTDHHWTAAGAYAAYVSLGAVLGYTPYPQEDFTPETVTDVFFGTSAAAAGIPAVRPDTVELRRFAGDREYRLTIDGKPAPFAGFYDMEKLQTHDKYAVFCGGNCGVLTAEHGEGDMRPMLLLLKDSFANCMIPYLARHYRVVAVDPRYANAAWRAWLPRADRVLVLCGMQTLAADTTIARFLAK